MHQLRYVISPEKLRHEVALVFDFPPKWRWNPITNKYTNTLGRKFGLEAILSQVTGFEIYPAQSIYQRNGSRFAYRKRVKTKSLDPPFRFNRAGGSRLFVAPPCLGEEGHGGG